MSPTIDFLNGNFSAAFVGAVVGGGFTLVGTLVAHALERKKLREADLEQEIRLLQALHDEFNAVWTRYETNLGGDLMGLNVQAPLTSTFPIYSDFFPVYKGSTSLIGAIKNDKIRFGLINAYTQASGLIDSFTLNNALIADWDEKVRAHGLNPTPASAERANDALSALISYTQKLKILHVELQAVQKDLLELIRNEIANRRAGV